MKPTKLIIESFDEFVDKMITESENVDIEPNELDDIEYAPSSYSEDVKDFMATPEEEDDSEDEDDYDRDYDDEEDDEDDLFGDHPFS